MKHTPNADTKSPWYEAFTNVTDKPALRWLAGTETPAEPAERPAAGVEEQWATEALFDYYNGE